MKIRVERGYFLCYGDSPGRPPEKVYGPYIVMVTCRHILVARELFARESPTRSKDYHRLHLKIDGT